MKSLIEQPKCTTPNGFKRANHKMDSSMGLKYCLRCGKHEHEILAEYAESIHISILLADEYREEILRDYYALPKCEMCSNK